MDRIYIEKSRRQLTFYTNGQRVFQCAIGLGTQPVGHKMLEGDGRTPEGMYYVCVKNDRSKYHLSLGVSYPNVQDAQAGLYRGAIDGADFSRIERAQRLCRRPPWDTALGGFIMIHGGGASDWTKGCIALDDRDIDMLFAMTKPGTAIEIVP